MMNLEGLTAVIINPDMGSRSRLREVLKNAVYKITLSWMQSLREATERIDTVCANDVALVSSKLGEDQVRNYISSVIQAGKSKVPSFIVTLDGKSHDTIVKVSSMYLDGVEGFITEPYSSDDLVRLLVAIKGKKVKEDSLAKQKKSMQFIFYESVRCVDLLAKNYAYAKNPSPDLLKEVNNLSQSLVSLYDQNADLYISVMADIYEKVLPPAEHIENRRRKVVRKLILHPGRIASDLMHERKLNLERLQGSLRMEIAEFQEFLDCKRPLDEHLSRELSRLFGKTSREWLKLQKDYDRFLESESDKKGGQS